MELTALKAAVAAAIALLTSLRTDLAYFAHGSQPVALGEATELDAAALSSNTYVSVSGSPMASRTIQYSRLFGGTYSVFPLAGQRRVFVQVASDDQVRARQASRRDFSGRLVTMADLGGRFASVRQHYETIGVPVTGETFVLLADEPPGSYGWAVGLALLCLLFGLINLLLLMRWFRPIRIERKLTA